MNWSAWDSEGNKYTEETHTWDEVPVEYTVALTLHLPTHKNMYNGCDAIWWDGEAGRAYSLDIPPVMEEAVAEFRGNLKIGLQIDNDLWIRITEEAIAEPLRAA